MAALGRGPAGDDPDPATHELYVKSHGRFEAGEQRNLGYNWLAHGIDPTSFRCAVPSAQQASILSVQEVRRASHLSGAQLGLPQADRASVPHQSWAHTLDWT